LTTAYLGSSVAANRAWEADVKIKDIQPGMRLALVTGVKYKTIEEVYVVIPRCRERDRFASRSEARYVSDPKAITVGIAKRAPYYHVDRDQWVPAVVQPAQLQPYEEAVAEEKARRQATAAERQAKEARETAAADRRDAAAERARVLIGKVSPLYFQMTYGATEEWDRVTIRLEDLEALLDVAEVPR
jgi:hypothetical protein